MITNACDLNPDQKLCLAEKVSALSQEKNSSLLPRSKNNVLSDIEKKFIYAAIQDDDPLFLIAFEPTGNPLYTEVGMTCNIAPDRIRGKHIFPQIVEFYRHTNGNGKKILYLTTTDIRMFKVALRSGFRQQENVRNFFPPEVLDFCCSPCSPEKTGVAECGQQKDRCPRFEGQFLPKLGDECTHQRCWILSQII